MGSWGPPFTVDGWPWVGGLPNSTRGVGVVVRIMCKLSAVRIRVKAMVTIPESAQMQSMSIWGHGGSAMAMTSAQAPDQWAGLGMSMPAWSIARA